MTRKLDHHPGACYPGSMLRLALKLSLAAAALWAVFSFVPVGDRTLADRWKRAGTPAAFLEGAWAELKGEPAAKPAPPRSRARAPSREGARAARPPAPTEDHTEADRRALDRLLAEQLRDAPAR